MFHKTKINIVSAYTISPKISDVPVLPLGSLPNWANLMSYDVPFNHPSYDEFGDDVEGVPRIFPDDFDYEEPHNAEALRLTDEYLNHPFVLAPTDQIPDDTIKSLNSHIVTGINVYQSQLPQTKDVLILCAGNGEDVNRLSRDTIDSARSIDLIGTTGLNPRAALVLRQFRGKVRSVKEHLHHVPDSFFNGKEYDLIVCHHGLHHVMRDKAGVLALIRVINLLTPSGVLLGDKIDMMGLDTLHNFSHLPSHGVELLSVSPASSSSLEGQAIIRVKDMIWKDPILSDKRLYDSVPPGFVVHILQGGGAFKSRNIRGRPFTPPATVLSASRRPEVRIVSYVEIARSSNVPTPVPINPPCVPHGFWEECDELKDYVMALMNFDINKGKHFQPCDIPYVGDNSTLYSEKTDGQSCRVVVGEGSAYMFVHGPKPRYFVARGYDRSGYPILRLQCEYMPDGSVVLLDPVHLGIDTPSGFLPRLKHYESMLASSPWVAGLVRSKVWYSSFPPMDLVARWEGVVVMGVTTPSPWYGPRYASTARYSKWIPTIDIQGPNGIIEVNARTGAFIRDRPDKDKPNSSANAAEVINSISPGDLSLISSVGYDSELEAKALNGMSGVWDGKPSLGLMVVLKYPNRPASSPKLNSVKSRFLEEVGFKAPDNPERFVPKEEFIPHLQGWDLDIGLEGGGGNSKGDGPGCDDYCQSCVRFNPWVPLFHDVILPNLKEFPEESGFRSVGGPYKIASNRLPMMSDAGIFRASCGLPDGWEFACDMDSARISFPIVLIFVNVAEAYCVVYIM